MFYTYVQLMNFISNNTTLKDSAMCKRVHFNLKPDIFYMKKWDYAYREARKGCWHLYAIDRFHFQRKINKIDKILSPILAFHHRRTVFQERFVCH